MTGAVPRLDLGLQRLLHVTLRPWNGAKGQVHKGRWSDNYFRGIGRSKQEGKGRVGLVFDFACVSGQLLGTD